MTHIFLDKDEMNINKFKIEVDLICDKLGEIDLTADSINPLTFIWGNKVENPYTQTIINRSFKNKRRPADFANAYKAAPDWRRRGGRRNFSGGGSSPPCPCPSPH